MQRLSVVTLLCVIAVTIIACAVGNRLLVHHLVGHDAALAADLARLALTRSLPPSAFDPSAPTDPADYARAVDEIVAAADVVRVILYDRQARVLWSDNASLVGRRFTADTELLRALNGNLQAHILRPSKAEQEALRTFARVEEIYIPVRYVKDGPVVGALEIYRYPAAFFRVLDRGCALVWLLGGSGGLVLYTALFAVVRFRVVDVGSPKLGAARDAARAARSEAALRRMNDTLEAETKRIAHEVHDEAGQLLVAAKLALADVAREMVPETRESFRQVSGVLDEIADQLRRLSHELRPAILDDLGLVPALEFLAQGVSNRTALDVRVEASADGRLPSMVETALYRIVQEAVTNVVKHARAMTVTIRVEQGPRRVRCSIEDDGLGFDVPTALSKSEPRGMGLLGIRNRVEALGGTFQIIAAAADGTRLLVSIPLS